MPEIGASTRFTFTIQGLSSTLFVAGFEGVEAVSELFEFELALTSEDADIVFADVVGKPALLMLESDGSETRYVNGIVSRFRRAEDGKKLTVYRATLVPAHWRLRHRHDGRIFQALTAPEIIAKVLDGAGLASGTDYRLSLGKEYALREYCVQYRESDHAFISRLMEEEGIVYFFEHAEDKHVMVLVDATAAHTPIPKPDTIAYRTTLGAMAHGESVSRFSYTEEVQPGKVTLSDFNFTKPSLSLLASSEAALDTDLEVYDYPGEYDVPGAGEALSKVRLEEHRARYAVADGESGCIRMTPGYLFTLSEHPRDADNRRYLLTRVRHRGSQAQMSESVEAGTPSYSNAFQAIPSDVPYRPERRTPRPTIKGVQTAIVTGPAGEEIHTDEHGRVKVHFHWDRLGKMDEKSSCWIRVSQLWAGQGWGAMWIPRVGHEVIVDFIEGDPDRPIIVGRVYHGTNVPPYPLPGEKTKSTIKSDSSPGGGGSNELRFEDRKGQEEIFMHAQKDMTVIVLHDEREDVGHDLTLHVGHDQNERVDNDRSASVGANEHIDVGGNRDATIVGNEALSVGKNRSVNVSGSHTESVAVAQAITVGAAQSVNVGAAQSVSVAGAMSLAVGASKSESVGAQSSESVGAGKTVGVGAGYSLNVGKDMSVSVGKNAKEEVADQKTVIVGKKLTVQVGDATITIEKNGNITVKGKKIVVAGDGPIEVEGKKLTVKSEGAVNVEASGKIKIKGSQVGVN